MAMAMRLISRSRSSARMLSVRRLPTPYIPPSPHTHLPPSPHTHPTDLFRAYTTKPNAKFDFPLSVRRLPTPYIPPSPHTHLPPSPHTHPTNLLRAYTTKPNSKFDFPLFETLKNFKVPKPSTATMKEIFGFFHYFTIPEYAEAAMKFIKHRPWIWRKMNSLVDIMTPQIKEDLRRILLGLPGDFLEAFKSQFISLGCAKLLELLGLDVDPKGPRILLNRGDPSINLEGLLKSLNAKTILIIPIQDDLDWNKFKGKNGAENGKKKNGADSGKKNGAESSNGAENGDGKKKNGAENGKKNGAESSNGAENGDGKKKNGAENGKKNGAESSNGAGKKKNGAENGKKNGAESSNGAGKKMNGEENGAENNGEEDSTS